jgi:hypothetical protein
MTATLVVAGLLLAALLWFFLGGRSAPDRPGATPGATHRENPDIDYAELEQAERDVQEAPDAENVRDWGPGVQKPPLG